MTSNLSHACNMCFTQCEPLVERPTTIVCDTFQEHRQRRSDGCLCWFVCRVHRQSGAIRTNPMVYEHTAFKKFESERCRLLKFKGKCQPNGKSLAHRDQHAIVLDEVIHGDIPKRFRWNILTCWGQGQEKEMWPERGEFCPIWNIANNTTDTASNRKPLRETLRAVVASQAHNCLTFSCNDFVLRWRKCKPKDEPNDYCRQLNSAVKKTGFNYCGNSWIPNVSHWCMYNGNHIAPDTVFQL